ncbi:hypothetical protein K488DRAFT_71834 [Vararia minispora EC-137]|uniref:Uncharacterized protein n=1 Tax=Vararia minispora EC-137 TaxID=1314806 RepID=A0ACB8QGF3_9AGAM|nr:hypothetical protein K488DRAFT_71834 [Vararia minispora EC-137]
MSYPTFKIISLAVSTVGYYASFTPPNAVPNETESYDVSFFSRATRQLSFLHKAIACVMLMYETLAILAVAHPSAFISPTIQHALCPTPDVTRLLSVTSTFVLGTALMLSGSLIRVWCFRTLGTLFTFELTIQPKHILRTDGPYAFVRHPSYISATLIVLGFVFVHYAASECVSATVWYIPVMSVYLVEMTWATPMLWKRGPVEDGKLREKFGEEWEAYRGRVPWGFIPFVY